MKAKLRSAIYFTGLIGLLLAALTLERPDRDELPDPTTLLAVLSMSVLSLAASARQWSTLLGVRGPDRLHAHRSLYVSQLSKYLPAGGVVQAAGQIALTTSPDRSATDTFRMYVTGLFQLVGACCTVALILAATADETWLQVVGLIAIPGASLVHPRVMEVALRAWSGLFKRIGGSGTIPAVGTLLRAQGFAFLNIGLLALSFAVLLMQADPAPGLLPIVGAFSLAWLAGFLVAPVPAGLGVREAALVALVPGMEPASVVLAGVTLRIIGLGAEVTAVALNAVWRRASASS